jgi:molybdenum ABC transporter molybdate-binding protein
VTIHKALHRLLSALAILTASTAQLCAEKIVEHSAEARFQLDLHVTDAALAAFLPTGWIPNIATQGPAKDCNLRVVFIDRITINGPDGKPAGRGSNSLVYLAAPVKDPSGANTQLIIGGLTADSSDAPGPFGNYLPATTHSLQRSTASAATGPVLDSQDWAFAAATGERFELRIKFERGTGNKGNPADVRFYSAKTPGFYQVSRQEQVLDILRNSTTNPPDRVKDFSFKASGGSYAKLFDGTEKVLSWDNIIWLNRTVLLPSEVTLIAPGGIRAAVEQLIPDFEKTSGSKVRAAFGSGLGTKKQIVQGEAFDVPIIQPPYPEVLASGNVVASSATTLASVSVGVAVRKGDPKPDISTPDAVKRTLLAAKSIAYPDPSGGAAAGVSFDETLKKLGIAAQVEPKLKRAQGGAGAMAMAAKGEAEIGLTFLSEMSDPGIDVVGPLPREISTPTTLVGFVSSHASDPAGAKALLDYLSSQAAAAVYKAQGMQPAH